MTLNIADIYAIIAAMKHAAIAKEYNLFSCKNTKARPLATAPPNSTNPTVDKVISKVFFVLEQNKIVSSAKTIEKTAMK